MEPRRRGPHRRKAPWGGRHHRARGGQPAGLQNTAGRRPKPQGRAWPPHALLGRPATPVVRFQDRLLNGGHHAMAAGGHKVALPQQGADRPPRAAMAGSLTRKLVGASIGRPHGAGNPPLGSDLKLEMSWCPRDLDPQDAQPQGKSPPQVRMDRRHRATPKEAVHHPHHILRIAPQIDRSTVLSGLQGRQCPKDLSPLGRLRPPNRSTKLGATLKDSGPPRTSQPGIPRVPARPIGGRQATGPHPVGEKIPPTSGPQSKSTLPRPPLQRGPAVRPQGQRGLMEDPPRGHPQGREGPKANLSPPGATPPAVLQSFLSLPTKPANPAAPGPFGSLHFHNRLAVKDCAERARRSGGQAPLATSPQDLPRTVEVGTNHKLSQLRPAPHKAPGASLAPTQGKQLQGLPQRQFVQHHRAGRPPIGGQPHPEGATLNTEPGVAGPQGAQGAQTNKGAPTGPEGLHKLGVATPLYPTQERPSRPHRGPARRVHPPGASLKSIKPIPQELPGRAPDPTSNAPPEALKDRGAHRPQVQAIGPASHSAGGSKAQAVTQGQRQAARAPGALNPQGQACQRKGPPAQTARLSNPQVVETVDNPQAKPIAARQGRPEAGRGAPAHGLRSIQAQTCRSLKPLDRALNPAQSSTNSGNPPLTPNGEIIHIGANLDPRGDSPSRNHPGAEKNRKEVDGQRAAGRNTAPHRGPRRANRAHKSHTPRGPVSLQSRPHQGHREAGPTKHFLKLDQANALISLGPIQGQATHNLTGLDRAIQGQAEVKDLVSRPQARRPTLPLGAPRPHNWRPQGCPQTVKAR